MSLTNTFDDSVKKRKFDSDRYFELRHEFEMDFHEDYDYSNAVAYGTTESIEKTDNRTIGISVNLCNQYDGELERYEVSIEYLENGRYGPLSNPSKTEFYGCWFDEDPITESDEVSFDNCVFDVDVNFTKLKNAYFRNCFFLKNIDLVDCRDCVQITLEHCIVKHSLSMDECKTDIINIIECNVLGIFIMKGFTVEKRTIVYGLNVGLVAYISESTFHGNEVSFKNMKTGYGLDINNCVFDVSTDMFMCETEEIIIRETVFKNLSLDEIYTRDYHHYEELVKPLSSDEDTHDDCIEPLDYFDNDSIKKKGMHKAIDAAFKKKSSIQFLDIDFEGVVNISKAVTSTLAICGCRAYDIFSIVNKKHFPEYDMSNLGRSILHDKTKKEYDQQFLLLNDTIFYEEVRIDNNYRFIDLLNTRFKEYSDIDADYLNITKGWPIKIISNDNRLIHEDTQSVMELYKSCNNEDHPRKEKLFLDAKTMEIAICMPSMRLKV